MLTVLLGFAGLHALIAAGSLGAAISTARGQMVGPALFAVVAVLVLCERRWPAERRPLLARGHLVDACYLALFAVLVAPVLTVVQTGMAVEVRRYAPALSLDRVDLGERVVLVAVILVAVDGLNWFAHWANHRWQSLWRLHALHHSQEEMGVFTTFRTHPLIHSVYLVSLFPALLLGAGGLVPAGAVIAYGCLVTLPHANLRWTFGPLGRVLVSPAYHRVHHARDLPADDQAVNLGFVLVCWDRLAGRAEFPIKGELIKTGLLNRPVTVEQTGGWLEVPQALMAQLAQPFRRSTALER